MTIIKSNVHGIPENGQEKWRERGEKSYSRPENADAAGRMENKMPCKIVRYLIYDNTRDLPLIGLRTCVCIRSASIRAARMGYGTPETGTKGGR